MAELTTYRMHTHILLAEGAGARDELRAQLLARGFTGWTERETVGFWLGSRVDGQTEFEVCAEECEVDQLADSLTAAHADQPAGVFQLVYIAPDGARTLVEARAERVAA